MIEDAIALAVAAHRGQRYPSPEGEPFVFHPLRVMLAFTDPTDQMAAILHDVVEDSSVALADLVQQGFPAEVVAAVEALTHRVGEPYEHYLDRVVANPVARRVKTVDVGQNLANNRRSPDAPGNAERIARYEHALARLESTGPSRHTTAYVPLPASGSAREQRIAARETFDQVAVLYDQARPGYPAEMFEALAGRHDLGPETRILEIGAGTGQATRDLAAYGAQIACLEPGPALADLARQNLAAYSNVTITAATFEEADLETCAFDVVFAATAFHWIDAQIGYPKAAAILRQGGLFALATNALASGGSESEIHDDVRTLLRHHAPEIADWDPPAVDEITARMEAIPSQDIAAIWAALDRTFDNPPATSDLFEPARVEVFSWTATYDTDSYLALLASHSSYALLPRREQLFDEIGALIDRRLGGTITKQYATVLATARRR